MWLKPNSGLVCKWPSATVLVSLFVIAVHSQTQAQEAGPQDGSAPKLVDPSTLDGRENRPLLLENFRPKPDLRVKETNLERAKFPVIDIHTHFRIRTKQQDSERDRYLELMNRNAIAICVSLDGNVGGSLDEHMAHLGGVNADRFAVMANIDWRGPLGKADDPATWDCFRDDFEHRVRLHLEAAKTQGAIGVKIFKDLGLGMKNPDGTLVRIDDPRWDPIWKTCGDLGLPVLIHAGDPVAFFKPIDQTNERWEELHRRPEWSFFRPDFPSHKEIVSQFLHVVERHPETTFIGAHIANLAEDLGAIRDALSRYPNLYVEIASRIGELGRQPFSARRFFIDWQDRILFGTDGPWPEVRVRYYWRFLETDDEYFPYSEKEFPPQGFWRIYGVSLPDEALRKVYYENALKIFPDLKPKYERASKTWSE